jgi:hypothetical protein
MNSYRLRRFLESTALANSFSDLSEWQILDDKCIDQSPQKPGVYFFRKYEGKQIGRLWGRSDILYIGSTIAKGGIKKRLRRYLHPEKGYETTNRRINLFLSITVVEVAWCTLTLSTVKSGSQTDYFAPDTLEYQLLDLYNLQHGELPPLNHATKWHMKGVGDDGYYVDRKIGRIVWRNKMRQAKKGESYHQLAES